MKSLNPALQAHLDDGTTTLSWCWRITRADGMTFGFTDHDRTLSFDGTEFEPESSLTAWCDPAPTCPWTRRMPKACYLQTGSRRPTYSMAAGTMRRLSCGG